MLNKYICIHAHFYQPPRENPWTQEIEIQESAEPYKNWNKRITEECYSPNASARILDKDSRIKKIINNYSRMSFNFGPTLLSWLESQSPETYQAILEADKESQRLFEGHGSALAQPYNHMIMPLANSADKLTQIIWGIEDFKLRFKRNPVGVWLPEAAVDIETLDLLAGDGIRFTILAPSQAKKIRSGENSSWVSVTEDSLDTTRPYKIQLPSGREFSVFFYDKNVSHQVAFENLLSNGDRFFNSLTSRFSTDTGKPELVHAATDGESYGHHHKFGEMTLAYVLDRLQNHESYSLTNYSKYLVDHPTAWEVEIIENTSWSCAHGIERWRSDCGCHTGGQEDWSQAWRKPLRDSLDGLRDCFNEKFQKYLDPLLKDPWSARNDYIHLLQSNRDFKKFFENHGVTDLNEEQKINVLKWMEIQRHAMLMYTSCGWFFNDISGIETEQVLRYASFALELFSQLDETSLEGPFVENLGQAKSNIPKWKNGNFIYKKMVESNRVSVNHIFSCGLLAYLLGRDETAVSVGSCEVENIRAEKISLGKSELYYGRGDVIKSIFMEKISMAFFALHEGDGDFKIFVTSSLTNVKEVQDRISNLFRREGYEKTRDSLKETLGQPNYPDRAVFHNFFDKLADDIGGSFWSENDGLNRKLLSSQKKFLLLHNRMDTPLPSNALSLSRLLLFEQWKEILDSPGNSRKQIQHMLKFSDGQSLDNLEFKSVYHEKINQAIIRIKKSPRNIENLHSLNFLLGLLDTLPMKVNLWTAQNEMFDIINSLFQEMQNNKLEGDKNAGAWVEEMEKTLNYLNISPEASC